MPMLTLETRPQWRTLLDSATLLVPDERPAIIYLETDKAPVTVTRSQFMGEVIRCAAALQTVGIGARDLVIIAHIQNLESIYGFWGALWLGAVPSMFPTLTEKLDPDHYMQSMAELTRRSEAKAVLTTDTFAPELAKRCACPVYGTSDWLPDRDEQSETTNMMLRRPKPGEIAFLQHSSGTTGLQKGVALSHQAVLNQLASYASALELSEKDVIVSWLPLYHDMGLIAGFIQPILQGIPLVLMSPFDWVQHPALLLRAIHEYRATLCWLPNFAYNHLARRVRVRDSEGLDLSSVRAFINCSEPVRQGSHQLFLERFAANSVTANQLAVSYAMAENTFAVTQSLVGEIANTDMIDLEALQRDLRAASVAADAPHAAPQVSCGKPIANTMVKIIGDQGEVLPERSVGEVLVKSDCMLTGYYHRPDLQPFDAEGWYKTGDRGYIADGEIYIVGRSKDLIITAGKNIYSQDIEAIIYEVEGIHPGRAVVFGVPDEREGTELIAIVAEVDVTDEADRKVIYQALRQQVVRAAEVSVSFVSLVERGWLIKTSSGKTARTTNREKWLVERADGRL